MSPDDDGRLLTRWFLFALACWLVGVLLGIRAFWGTL